MTVKYSVCTTTYKSVDLVDDFMRPFVELGPTYEVVVVDNDSRDGTIEKLSKYGSQTNCVSKKCTRGDGRQTAIDLSNGTVIVNVEFDVGYTGIENAIEYFENSEQDKIYYFVVIGQKCNASLYVGKKELFLQAGGFPDLNYAEDLYLNKNAQKKGLLSIVDIEMPIECLEISGLSSGKEARYEKKFLKLFLRRIFATRDILFVNNIGYKQLMQKYKLRGAKAIIIGIPEYVLGKFLQFTIKIPPVE